MDTDEEGMADQTILLKIQRVPLECGRMPWTMDQKAALTWPG